MTITKSVSASTSFHFKTRFSTALMDSMQLFVTPEYGLYIPNGSMSQRPEHVRIVGLILFSKYSTTALVHALVLSSATSENSSSFFDFNKSDISEI